MALQSWMLEVENLGLVKVAEALGLRVDGQIPCTSCGLPVLSGFSHWRCPGCATRGNALMYAVLALESRQGAPSWPALRQTLAARGLCQAA